jgi:hypothetical protein
VHDLARDELSDRHPNDIGAGGDIVDDAPHLRRGQPSLLGAEPQHELVAVDGVDVEVDSDT